MRNSTDYFLRKRNVICEAIINRGVVKVKNARLNKLVWHYSIELSFKI
jgi:hypothetical protein